MKASRPIVWNVPGSPDSFHGIFPEAAIANGVTVGIRFIPVCLMGGRIKVPFDAEVAEFIMASAGHATRDELEG